MNILQVTPYFFPSIGGIENHVLALSKYLVKKGNEVSILTSGIRSSPKSEIIDNIHIYRFKPFISPLENPIAFQPLFKLMKIQEYDIVHAHDEHGFTTNQAAFAKRINRKPLVITCHGDFYPITFRERFIIKTYERSLLSFSLKRSDAVIALSETHKDQLKRFDIAPNKIHVIPNAIDIAKIDTNADPTQFINKYKLEDKNLILYVGQLLKRKGVQYLLKAMLKVKEEVKNAVLIIIGKGPYKSKLQEIVKRLNLQNSIIFTGYVPKEELFQAYSACDLVVLPSLAEGVPTILFEAMLFSKPIIATRIESFPKTLSETLISIPRMDIKQLEKWMITLLENKSIQKKIGELGRVKVKEFGWDTVSDHVAQLYNTILS